MGIRCMCQTVLVISTVAVSIAMIVVGGIHSSRWNQFHQHFDSTCTAEPRIPAYLIVAGVLTLALLIAKFLFQVLFDLKKYWLSGRICTLDVSNQFNFLSTNNIYSN